MFGYQGISIRGTLFGSVIEVYLGNQTCWVIEVFSYRKFIFVILIAERSVIEVLLYEHVVCIQKVSVGGVKAV